MSRVRILAATLALAVLVAGASSTAKAGACGVGNIGAETCLYYGGDFNGVNGLFNDINYAGSLTGIVYDNVLVGSGGWNVNSIFTNNLFLGTSYVQSYYEIRSGVSPGNGGTLLYSGLSPASQAYYNGQNGFGLYGFTWETDGLNIHLNPGQYWISDTPISYLGNGLTYESTTSGAGCVNCSAHQANNAYFNSSGFGYYFAPTSAVCTSFAPCSNFSFGVGGSSGGQVTPEPASLMLFGSGLLGLGGVIRRRLGK